MAGIFNVGNRVLMLLSARRRLEKHRHFSPIMMPKLSEPPRVVRFILTVHLFMQSDAA
jgi:hypothetical protein